MNGHTNWGQIAGLVLHILIGAYLRNPATPNRSWDQPGSARRVVAGSKPDVVAAIDAGGY
jgi:hypothetical protein